ncbi:MAG: hypothetical protein JHC34_08655 [Acidobacteria bacterium]|nr:hypothetical protein [Acidobacteriota bacterium]
MFSGARAAAALMVMAGFGAMALEPGSVESQRMRAMALDAIVQAKQASIQASWKEIASLEAQIAQLPSADSSDGDAHNMDKARELLQAAEKRRVLEERRLELLREITSGYAELQSARQMLSEVRSQLRQNQQVLDGHWAVTIMPSGVRGDFYLSQNGTLVSGEYRLENGQTGNLQGTLIAGHLLLDRTDSSLGKIGRYEAQVMKDQNSLRGTWYSYDVMSGQPLTGAFAMDRVQEEGSP